MSRKPHKGIFVPKNPEKYIGGNVNNVTYRSSWELMAMQKFDTHPDIVGWNSECIQIPYYNPVQRRHTVYIPDFLVKYQDKSGNERVVMLEVKPAKEDPTRQVKGKLTENTVLVRAINLAKWKAAQAFCAKRGIDFKVITEAELFAFTRSS